MAIKLTLPVDAPIPITAPEFHCVPVNGKAPKWDVSERWISLEEADEGLENYAVQIPNGFIVLDFDQQPDVDIMLSIIRTLNIKCRVMETTKGIHVWFRTDRVWTNSVKKRLVCGLTADFRSHGKTSVVVWRYQGEDREWIIDTPWEEVTVYPKWLHPGTKKTVNFIGMDDGDGRNSALTEYIWSLQQNRAMTKSDIVETFDIINRFIFKTPLSDREMDIILRDDTFIEPKSPVKSKDEVSAAHGQSVDDVTDTGAPWLTVDGKFDHEGMAEFLTMQHILIFHNDTLYKYSEGAYRPLRSIYELETIINRHHPYTTIKQRKETVETLKTMVYTVIPSDKDREYTICCANGRLDVRTGTLSPHTPDAYDLQQIPTAYEPDAHSDRLDAIIKRLFPDADVQLLFEEMIGYCLIKNLKYRCAFYLVGDGSNGKSTILNMIKRMLGYENVSTLTPDEFLPNSFLTADLENKLANIGDDISSHRMKDNAIFKKACTGEGFTVQRKFGHPFVLESYATNIFACNEMPGTSDQSYGAESRRIIIPLQAQFLPTDKDFDPNVGDYLKTPEAMSALLAKAVKGAIRLIKNKHFTSAEIVLKMAREFKFQNNYVGQWIVDECLKPTSFHGKTVHEMRNKFRQWCADNELKTDYSPQKFGKNLNSVFPELKSEIIKRNGEVFRVYHLQP